MARIPGASFGVVRLAANIRYATKRRMAPTIMQITCAKSPAGKNENEIEEYTETRSTIKAIAEKRIIIEKAVADKDTFLTVSGRRKSELLTAEEPKIIPKTRPTIKITKAAIS